MRPRKSPNGYYRRLKKRTHKQEHQPGTQAEWEMVKLTRWIIGLSIITSVVAIWAAAFTGLQWWEAHSSGAIAEQQAKAALTLSNAARAQVRVSRQQADTAEKAMIVNQEAVEGTLRMAGAAELQAKAATTQADAARIQVTAALQALKVTQDPKVDVILQKIRPYDFDSGFVAEFRVVSAGSYTIEGAKVYVATDLLPFSDVQTIWSKLYEAREIDIVPNTPHEFPLILPPITEYYWSLFVSDQIGAVHAIRIEFQDASGRMRSIERCVAYSGRAENIARFDCAEGRSKKK